jgi:hypothetical protein
MVPEGKIVGSSVFAEHEASCPALSAQLERLEAMRDGLVKLRPRIGRLTVVSGLPDGVWKELCLIDSDLAALLALAPKAGA